MSIARRSWPLGGKRPLPPSSWARRRALRRALMLVVGVTTFLGVDLVTDWRSVFRETERSVQLNERRSDVWHNRELLNAPATPRLAVLTHATKLAEKSSRAKVAKHDSQVESHIEGASSKHDSEGQNAGAANDDSGPHDIALERYQQAHQATTADTKGRTASGVDGSQSEQRDHLKHHSEERRVNYTSTTATPTTTNRPVYVPTTRHPRHKIHPDRPNETCLQAAFHEFPKDMFSHRARAKGVVVLHMFVAIYMFYALAVVCDDYFIASLEECSQRLNLSDDVAGATFMAAGSSAPELFTAILGVIVAKGDVGTGTVVGSAVYNVLFVIAICGLYAGRDVPVTWWPLFRDSVFYAFTVVVLMIVIADAKVSRMESVVMLLLYGLYIALMKWNRPIHQLIATRLGLSSEVQIREMDTLTGSGKQTNFYGVSASNQISFYEAALITLCGSGFRPKTRFWAAAKRIMYRRQLATRGHPALARSESIALTTKKRFNWRVRPPIENGLKDQALYWIRVPLLATLDYTIPDCKSAGPGSKMFLVTFVMSIWWTAVFSYFMVWMVTLIGFTLRIPDSIMGITFLAAGTSIPDAYASLLVSKQGQGDMAIANCFGSNVFDILVGLSIPWLIQTTWIDPSGYAIIFSRGLLYTVVLLFLTIIITIVAIQQSGWYLTKKLGALLMITYVIFLVLCSAIEFNIFGHVSPPTCPEPDM